MGFNAVLTSLLYIGYLAGTYHVLQRSKMPLAVRCPSFYSMGCVCESGIASYIQTIPRSFIPPPPQLSDRSASCWACR